VRKADNLPPSCAVVTKSGSLNFLEPFGTVMGLLYLYSKVFSDCLPSYITATRPVLEIFKMDEYFPDSPRIYYEYKLVIFIVYMLYSILGILTKTYG